MAIGTRPITTEQRSKNLVLQILVQTDMRSRNSRFALFADFYYSPFLLPSFAILPLPKTMKVTCPILPLPKVGKLTLSRAPCCPQTFVLACAAAVAAADVTVKLVCIRLIQIKIRQT